MILAGFHSIYRWVPLAILLFFIFCCGGYSQNGQDFKVFDLKIKRLRSSDPYRLRLGISEGEVKLVIEKELKKYFNSGFPFAQANFDTLTVGSRTEVCLTIDLGPPMINGPIILEADTSFNVKMLSRFLRFKAGQSFSLEKFSRIPVLANQLPMAKSVRPPTLEWFGEKAVLHVYLEKRRNNSFTGILGILPQPENSTPIVTGNIDASLQNLFGRGLALDLKWNRFAPSSQTAQVKILYEALGYNGLGIEAQADLIRQDSLLNRQRFEFRIITSPSGIWKYKAGIQSVSASSNFGSNNSVFQKINTQSLTFSVVYEIASSRQIELKSRYFYAVFRPTLKSFFTKDGEQKIPQADAQIQFAWPIPLSFNRFALQTSGQFSGVWSESILVPDQFQAGGIKSIRGFNENSFFTTQYALVTIQPRFLIDKNTLFNIFGQAMAFNPALNSSLITNPNLAFSMGLGLELDLGANQIQLSLANGFSKNAPFDLQTSKIHFGYVARF